MLPELAIPMANDYVCRSCLQAMRRTLQRRPRVTALKLHKPPHIGSYLQRAPRQFSRSISQTPTSQLTPPQDAIRQCEIAVQRIVEHPSVPSEAHVNEALQAIEAAALELHYQQDPKKRKSEADGSPTSAILSMNKQVRSSPVSPPLRTSKGEAEGLSYLAYRLLKLPDVFISSAIIEQYVTVQTLLSRPDSIPEIFNLYATKPQPQASSTPSHNVSYAPPKPDAPASAIPAATANLGLDAAIGVRNLPLALSVISTSVEKPAYRKNKFLRKGLPPVIGAGLTPLAAWTLATNMSEIQTGLPQETFTQIAFAGMATYAAAVGTIGYVALTSANDQMRRVTWAVGMPLKERWLREDERAAADRVACAWGFKETWRWGEEEGKNWEELKEWIGVRGMMLDKVGLMEGME